MDTRLQRKVERILALGYTEAAQRKSTASTLDALTEATAAVCDLFAPSLSAQTFYLSHIKVRFGDKIISSTLAPFDEADIARELDELVRPLPCEIRENCSLQLPSSAGAAADALMAFWNEAIQDFKVNPKATAAPNAVTVAVPQDVTEEFHASLRHAFDTIVHEDSEDAFTLRVDRFPEAYFLEPQSLERTCLALGYCLPSSRLLDVFDRLKNYQFPTALAGELEKLQDSGITRLSLLETPRRPKFHHEAFRSQSHTHVTTRTAALVRHQGVRSKRLAKPTTFALLDSERTVSADLVDALETAAWGGIPPANIFMMPLTNHALTSAGTPPQTVAHWYLALRDDFNPESLIARRFRATRLFSEVIYQRYQNAIARELAKRLIRGETAIDLLNGMFGHFAAAYSIAPPMEAKAAIPTQSLADRIRLAREAGVPRVPREQPWSRETQYLLGTVSIDCGRQRSSSHVDFLLPLVRSLEIESSRVRRGGHAAYEVLTEEFSQVTSQLRAIADAHSRIVASVEKIHGGLAYPEVRWSRLRTLKELVSGGGSCGHRPDNAQPCHVGDWVFAKVHECSRPKCPLLDEEVRRRVHYLLGWERLPASAALAAQTVTLTSVESLTASDTTRAWTESLLGNDAFTTDTLWELVKKAAQDSREDRPTIAALVMLLMMEGVSVSLDGLPEKCLLVVGVPPAWKLGLRGVASLTQPSAKRPGRPAAVRISLRDEGLAFELSGGELSYHTWVEQKALKKVIGQVPNTFANDRPRDIAAAYMLDWSRPVPAPAEGTIGSVTIRVTEASLTCIWRGVRLAEPGEPL